MWFAPSIESIVGNCLQLGVAPSTWQIPEQFVVASRKKIAILHFGSEYY